MIPHDFFLDLERLMDNLWESGLFWIFFGQKRLTNKTFGCIQVDWCLQILHVTPLKAIEFFDKRDWLWKKFIWNLAFKGFILHPWKYKSPLTKGTHWEINHFFWVCDFFLWRRKKIFDFFQKKSNLIKFDQIWSKSCFWSNLIKFDFFDFPRKKNLHCFLLEGWISGNKTLEIFKYWSLGFGLILILAVKELLWNLSFVKRGMVHLEFLQNCASQKNLWIVHKFKINLWMKKKLKESFPTKNLKVIHPPKNNSVDLFVSHPLHSQKKSDKLQAFCWLDLV